MHVDLIYLIAQCMVMDNLKMSVGYLGAPPHPHMSTPLLSKECRDRARIQVTTGWGGGEHMQGR